MVTLVHFHLINPIMVGKKKTNDVQFYTEARISLATRADQRKLCKAQPFRQGKVLLIGRVAASNFCDFGSKKSLMACLAASLCLHYLSCTRAQPSAECSDVRILG